MCLEVKTGELFDNYTWRTGCNRHFIIFWKIKSQTLRGELINCDVLIPRNKKKTEWWSLSIRPARDNRYAISSIAIVLKNIDENDAQKN